MVSPPPYLFIYIIEKWVRILHIKYRHVFENFKNLNKNFLIFFSKIGLFGLKLLFIVLNKTMKKITKVNGYKLVDDGTKYYVDNFPSFPNQNENSKRMFQLLEKNILKEKSIKFPIKLNTTERVLKLSKETEECFSLSGIINFINTEKKLFTDSNTFFKLKISYNNDVLELRVFYYTIDNDNGLTNCNSLEDLLNTIFINYDHKQFTKKRVEVLKNYINIDIDLIRQIPLIPVQWLNFDENGSLLDFPNIIILKD